MIAMSAIVMAVVVMVPASVGEYQAATQGQGHQQRNQHCDSAEHFKVLMVEAAMKRKLFIGCNMRPRL
jgi:hypothetical protein